MVCKCTSCVVVLLYTAWWGQSDAAEGGILPPAGGGQDCYIYSERPTGGGWGRGGGRAIGGRLRAKTGIGIVAQTDIWLTHNLTMIQHTEGWGGGAMICHSPYISLSPSTTRQTTLRAGRGGRFTAAQPASRSPENTPRYSKWLTVCLPSTVWQCQKAKKKKKKEKKGRKSTWKAQRNKQPDTDKTFKTGRATRHLHVLAPTKISRYIEEYIGPDRTNQNEKNKTKQKNREGETPMYLKQQHQWHRRGIFRTETTRNTQSRRAFLVHIMYNTDILGWYL